eukprot:1151457-Pelagomonas_calceolata.AAC.11
MPACAQTAVRNALEAIGLRREGAGGSNCQGPKDPTAFLRLSYSSDSLKFTELYPIRLLHAY